MIYDVPWLLYSCIFCICIKSLLPHVDWDDRRCACLQTGSPLSKWLYSSSLLAAEPARPNYDRWRGDRHGHVHRYSIRSIFNKLVLRTLRKSKSYENSQKIPQELLKVLKNSQGFFRSLRNHHINDLSMSFFFFTQKFNISNKLGEK